VEWRDSIFFLLLFAASAWCMEELRAEAGSHKGKRLGWIASSLSNHPSIHIHFYGIISILSMYYAYNIRSKINVHIR